MFILCISVYFTVCTKPRVCLFCVFHSFYKATCMFILCISVYFIVCTKPRVCLFCVFLCLSQFVQSHVYVYYVYSVYFTVCTKPRVCLFCVFLCISQFVQSHVCVYSVFSPRYKRRLCNHRTRGAVLNGRHACKVSDIRPTPLCHDPFRVAISNFLKRRTWS